MLDSLDDDFPPSRPTCEPFQARPLEASSAVRSYLRIEPAPLISGRKTHSVYLWNEVSLPYPFIRKTELFRVSADIAMMLRSPESGIEGYDREGNRDHSFEMADVVFFHEKEDRVSVWIDNASVAVLKGDRARELGLFIAASRKGDSLEDTVAVNSSQE